MAKQDVEGAQAAIKKHIENSMMIAIQAIEKYEESQADSIW